jgi:hypothetical protein
MRAQLRELTQFRVPSGFNDTVAALAQEHGMSASEFMRRSIREAIETRSKLLAGTGGRDDDGRIVAYEHGIPTNHPPGR